MSSLIEVTVEGSTEIPDVSGLLSNQPIIAPIILNGYSAFTLPAYWRGVRFLVDNLAQFPRSVHKDDVALKTAHPLDAILKRRPNGVQNAFTFWRNLWTHTIHCGRGYARIGRSSSGQPIALNLLLPEDVVPFTIDRLDGQGPQAYFLHKPTDEVIFNEDMIHLLGMSYDGMQALDPVVVHARTLQRAATIDRYQLAYFQRGTVVRGVIEVANEMTDAQLASFQSVLRQYQGVGQTDDVMILTGGAKFNNTTATAKDSEISAQASAVTKQIAQMLGIPPEFLFEMSEAKYNASISLAGETVVRYTLLPWITLAEDELTAKLLTDQEQADGYTVSLDPSILERGDIAQTTTTTIASVSGGIRTPNEGRAVIGLPADPDPDSDKIHRLGDTRGPAVGSDGNASQSTDAQR